MPVDNVNTLCRSPYSHLPDAQKIARKISKPGGNDDLGLDALDLTTYKVGESTDRGATNTEGDMFPDYKSGLNTPLASPAEHQIHQWGQSDAFVDDKMSSFSLDVQDVWGTDVSDSGLISCA